MTEPHVNSRVAWITGAAGGLGSALIHEFVAQGWYVLATYRQALPQPSTPNVLVVRADVTVRAEIDAAVQAALRCWEALTLW